MGKRFSKMGVYMINAHVLIRGPHFATTFDFHLATRSSLVICEENGTQEVPGLKDHPKWLRPLQLFY